MTRCTLPTLQDVLRLGVLQCQVCHTARTRRARIQKVRQETVQTEQDAQLGEAKEVMLEDQIPEFLASLGRKIQAESSNFETWYPSHAEEFAALVSEYSN